MAGLIVGLGMLGWWEHEYELVADVPASIGCAVGARSFRRGALRLVAAPLGELLGVSMYTHDTTDPVYHSVSEGPGDVIAVVAQYMDAVRA
jgi:hypothetical protein